MTKTELAKQLGISASMVSRLARRGMPTDSLERAQRWRRRHLEPGRMKGVRFDNSRRVALAQPPTDEDAPDQQEGASFGDLNVHMQSIAAGLKEISGDAQRVRVLVLVAQSLGTWLEGPEDPLLEFFGELIHEIFEVLPLEQEVRLWNWLCDWLDANPLQPEGL